MRIRQIGTLVGSPPRAWGQCREVAVGLAQLRFTPTGVGTICRGMARSSVISVHPHGRGDNADCPPHKARDHWFTPTGVGTISWSGGEDEIRSVHPHGRGDNRACQS